jgi:hypothetical protein
LSWYQGLVQTEPEQQQVRRQNPLLGGVDLPLSATYYPAGFPLEIMTNSRDVVESANESWGLWSSEFDRPPARISVIVQAGGMLAPPPSYRRHGRLFCIVSDADNYAIADLQALEGCVFVTARTAADHAWLRWYFVEAVAYTLLAQRYVVPVHAACVAHEGSGVLLCGASGAGKSTLSFACARGGWTFISDDCTWLLPNSGDPVGVGRPHQARFRSDAPQWFPELGKFVERVRPNGKLSLEVAMREFPEIRTSGKSVIGAMLLLNRVTGVDPRLEKIFASEIVEFLMQDAASYGDEVDRLRERTVQKLLNVPAYRLHYDRLGDGVTLLSKFC